MTAQPGWTIVEDGNGLLSSSVTFQGDAANAGAVPQIGASHPADSRLTAHRRDRAAITLGRERWVVHYVGISRDPTRPVINWGGGYGRERIETLWNFASEDIAGTIAAPQNTTVVVPIRRTAAGWTGLSPRRSGACNCS